MLLIVKKDMNRVVLELVLCLVLLPVLSIAVSEKPKEFPKVDLAGGSKPRYAAIAMDETQSKVAYILFDGNINSKDGYKIYVWIPDDLKYKNPVAMRAIDGNKFSPLSIGGPILKKDVASISWQLRWETRCSPDTDVDYVTGKTTKLKVVTYPVFGFSIDYLRGQGRAAVDITIHGEMSTSDTWEKLPNVLAPWDHVNFMMTFQPVYKKEKGRIQFKGNLYYGYWGCTVRSLPDDSEIMLTVSPYMEPPIYSNTLSVAEAFGTGVDVEVPYGWYNFTWSFTCDNLKTQSGYWGIYSWPYPFSKPVIYDSGP